VIKVETINPTHVGTHDLVIKVELNDWPLVASHSEPLTIDIIDISVGTNPLITDIRN